MSRADSKQQVKVMINWAEIPSVEKLLQSKKAKLLSSEFGRPLLVEEIREELGVIRSGISDGMKPPNINRILNRVKDRLESINSISNKPVINATGVILHTNLGRAPLSKSAIQAVTSGLQGYTSLEYDLVPGERNNRTDNCEKLLQKLLGVESALVVNNNASAVLLSLSALANKKRAIISRSQLVEVGGGFRIPDVMRQSGAKLVEIGTTNQVHLSDYQSALAIPSGLVLHVHSSNYKIIGFTGEPTLEEIAGVAHEFGVPVVDDNGSGAILDTSLFGLAHEPTVQESLSAGVDVVCFSGDKLFGGPQAGIIVGKKDYLDRIKKHPLARAVRADKTLLLGLEATLLHYLKDEAVREIPVWQMIASTSDEIQKRAENWRQKLNIGEVCKSQSTVGGGSLPAESLPTWVLAISVRKPNEFAARLRTQIPIVIARIQDGKIMFDPRTVFPKQEAAFISKILETKKEHSKLYEK
jgi:L-seryl-tRNA(Ser) seleniumtransferase